MKAFLTSTLIASLVLCMSAHAATQSADPLIGQWSVDTSRLPLAPAARPRQVLMAFGDAGEGRLAMSVDITDVGGTTIHAASTALLNGTPFPITGSPEADVGAMKQPGAGVLVLGLSKAGAPASTRIYSVDADHKSMTETVAVFDDAGRPSLRTHYFKRVR